jgi:hypothetical protein
MIRKVLIAIWIVLSLGWSGMFILIYLLGAGMSPGDANVSTGFFAYWFVPILLPALVYWGVVKYRLKGPGNREKSS